MSNKGLCSLFCRKDTRYNRGVRSIENSVQHSTGRTSNMIFIVVRRAYAQGSNKEFSSTFLEVNKDNWGMVESSVAEIP